MFSTIPVDSQKWLKRSIEEALSLDVSIPGGAEPIFSTYKSRLGESPIKPHKLGGLAIQTIKLREFPINSLELEEISIKSLQISRRKVEKYLSKLLN